MKNVVDDKGSFTVEISLLSIFIVVIVMNVVALICVMYDRGIICNEIDRSMLSINECEEKTEIAKLEENLSINNKLLCVNILHISYKVDENNIQVSIKYRIKYNSVVLFKNKKCYSFTKKMHLYDVKRYVRST